MEPVKGGALACLPEEAEQVLKDYDSNPSIASWAIRYAASLDNVMMVLSGMSNEEQVQDNIGYMKEFVPLNQEEMKMLEKVAELIRAHITVPCTSCHYCTEGCPMKIAIPEVFHIYNEYMKFPKIRKQSAKNQYKKLVETHGKASECVECGQCESHCPQHIEITKWLKEIAEVTEAF